MAHRAPLRVALFLLAAAAAACAPPLQNGGVEMRSGAAERLGVMCRFRRGDAEGGSVCVAPEEQAAPARVRRIAAAADKLSGPLAVGREGDLLLENDVIAVVIDKLGEGSGLAESGGNIVDAADAKARRDELGQIFTCFGAAPRQAIYDALDSGVDPKGTAWVEVRGHERSEEALRVVTRYELSPGQRALLITTTLANGKGAPLEGLDLGDAVQWGSVEVFAPGQPLGFQGEVSAPWMGGVGRFAAYGLLDAQPGAPGASLSVKSDAAFSAIRFARGVALAPGQKASYARALVVGPRGDTLGLATEILYLQGNAPGGIEVELFDPRGARLAPPEGGRVSLEPAPAPAVAPGEAAPPSTAELGVPLWLQIGPEMARAGANAAAEAPVGRYLVSFEGAGRHEAAKVPVLVEAGKVAKVRLAVSDAGVTGRAGASKVVTQWRDAAMIDTRTMETQRLAFDPPSLARAAALLREGRLVAFPTETVYGLGARADDAAAVRAIFAAKGRPSQNPLIVHVASVAAARELAAAWPDEAERLASAFWPGPLTLVVQRREGAVAPEVTAFGPTVAVRVPEHPVARALLEAAGLPVAAPSANRSTAISPTSADHVLKSLAGRIDAVLDGGPTGYGIESAIVDVSRAPAVLLRHGALSREALAAHLPVVDRGARVVAEGEVAPAPGGYARHYAPAASVALCPASTAAAEASERAARGVKVGLLGWGPHGLEARGAPLRAVEVLPSEPAGYAAGLYAALHRLEDAGCEEIVIAAVPATPAWAAVTDRLQRAAA